jgi:hypothetical protein
VGDLLNQTLGSLNAETTADQLKEALQNLGQNVTGLDDLTRQVTRTAAVTRLSELGIRGPAGLVDAALARPVAADADGQLSAATSADTEALREKGAAVLEAPDILKLVGQEVCEAGYAGDVRAPQTIYLSLASRLLERPVNNAVTGPSAAGKNFAVRIVLPFFPETAYCELSGASPLALVYNKESFAHRHVIVAESSALHTDGIGASLLRGLAWDQRLIYDTVIDGEHVRLEKDGPTGLITTSTRDLDRELTTRLWAVPIADTPGQTRAILAITAQRATRRLMETTTWAPFVAAQQWLEAVGTRDVVVPYAEALAELLPDHEVRLRRDFRQLLGLIQAHALIHQCTRERDASGCVVATLQDYDKVYAIVGDVFAASVGVSQDIRETVNALGQLVAAKGTGSTVTVVDVARTMGLTKSPAWYRVQKAIARDLIVNDETRKGQPARLRLGDPLEDRTWGLPDLERLVERTALREDGGSIETALKSETHRTVEPGG